MPKITLKFGTSVEETFKDFIASRKPKGLADKTSNSYEGQFSAIRKGGCVVCSRFVLFIPDVLQRIRRSYIMASSNKWRESP